MRIKAKFLNYLGYVVEKTQGTEQASEYYFKARDMYRQLNDEKGIQEINIGLSQYYTVIKNYEEAERLLTGALDYHRINGPESSYTFALICRGYLYLNREMYQKAEKDYLEYYEIAFNGQNKTFQINALNYNSELYLRMKDYRQAKDYAIRGNILGKEMGDTENRKSCLEYLIEIYTATNEISKLNETYKIYIELRDSIEHLGNNKAILDLETRYQTRQKQQEIELLTTQNNLAKQEKQNLFYLLGGSSILACLISLFFYMLYRNRQKTALQLEELDKAKSRFFTNISHEFRTPLTLIKTPVTDKLENNHFSEEEQRELLSIKQNTDYLLELVDQLLDISLLDTGGMKLKPVKDMFLYEISSITSSFEYTAKQRKIDYIVDLSGLDQECWLDRSVIEKVIINLVSNAFKYTPDNGRISVKAYLENEYFKCIITNTGQGISKANIHKIFDRFYQADEQLPGKGIGLSLVNELVTLHQGSIIVKSVPEDYTEFVISIPISPEFYKKEQLTEAKENTPTVLSPVIVEDIPTPESEKNPDRPVLLVVEDNKDMRGLFHKHFNGAFNIVEAGDGKEGIRIALEIIPDIIISDVMMPLQDGVALVNTLKADERTNHIPIILLTAMGGNNNIIKGLEIGADDYVTKPFDLGLLKARVKNLLKQRTLLIRKYREGIIPNAKIPEMPSRNREFLKKVTEILNKHITDPSFGPEEFSREFGSSRMQLHRKLKATTGLSTGEFIRTHRLKMASEMLKNPEVNVSEVCYSVGFNDLSYFSKCFKEMYSLTPSRYAKQSEQITRNLNP